MKHLVSKKAILQSWWWIGLLAMVQGGESRERMAMDARGNWVRLQWEHDPGADGWNRVRIVFHRREDGDAWPEPDTFRRGERTIAATDDLFITALVIIGPYVVVAGAFENRVRLGEVELEAHGELDAFVAFFDIDGNLVQAEQLGTTGYVFTDGLDCDDFGLNLIGRVDGMVFRLPLVRQLGPESDVQGTHDLGDRLLRTRTILSSLEPAAPFNAQPVSETGGSTINPNGHPPDGAGTGNGSGQN